MGAIQVRRLPVMNRDKRLVGVVSLGDIAFEAGKDPGGKALEGVSRPGGRYDQVDKATAGNKPG